MLMICFNFLGGSVKKLNYWGSTSSDTEVKTSKGKPRAITPLDEVCLVLAHLFITVSRIINTWINFLFLEFKNIPLWPPRDLVLFNMPKCFKVGLK